MHLAAQEFKQLIKAGKRGATDPSDHELHQLRIRTKRTRYAAELALETMGKTAIRFVRQTKRNQEILGDHQDAVVTEERPPAIAPNDPWRENRIRHRTDRRETPGSSAPDESDFSTRMGETQKTRPGGLCPMRFLNEQSFTAGNPLPRCTGFSLPFVRGG